MNARDQRLEELLDVHAGRGSGGSSSGAFAQEPPAAFIAAVRRRRRRIVGTRVILAALVVLTAAGTTSWMMRPRLDLGARTPAVAAGGSAESLARWVERELEARAGPEGSHRRVNSGMDEEERRLLRPGVRPDSEDVRAWLGSV